MKKISFILLLAALLVGCDLFDPLPENDLEAKMEAQITYAKAPWVPLFIETGGMGIANPVGPQPQLAKKAPLGGSKFIDYSFSIFFRHGIIRFSAGRHGSKAKAS